MRRRSRLQQRSRLTRHSIDDRGSCRQSSGVASGDLTTSDVLKRDKVLAMKDVSGALLRGSALARRAMSYVLLSKARPFETVLVSHTHDGGLRMVSMSLREAARVVA